MKTNDFFRIALLLAIAAVSLQGFPVDEKSEQKEQPQKEQHLRDATTPRDSSAATTPETTTPASPDSISLEWPPELEKKMNQLIDHALVSQQPVPSTQQKEDWWGEIVDHPQGHYDRADELFEQHQKNWTHWIIAERRLKLHEEAQQQAQERLKQEEANLKTLDLGKTGTGKFIEGCNDLTSVLQYAPAISNFNPLALSTQGAAVAAKYIQQGVVQAPKKAAKKALHEINKTTAAAKEEVLKARNATLQKNYSQIEKEAQVAEAHSIREAARRLKETSLVDSFWNDSSLSSFSLNNFSSQWKEERGKMLWQKRKETQLAELPHSLNVLEAVRKSYEEVQEKVAEANRTTEAAREKFDFLTQLKTQLEVAFENAIKQFGSLVNQTTLESTQALTQVQQEMMSISSYGEEVKKSLSIAQREFEEARRLGNIVETKASKFYKAYQSKIASADKKRNRMMARTEAYQAALNTYWLKRTSEAASQIEQTSQTTTDFSAAKKAFADFKNKSHSFLESSGNFSAKIAATAISEIEKIATVVKPTSQELSTALHQAASALGYFGNTISTKPGWPIKAKDHVRALQNAAAKITTPLWKEERDWTVAMVEKIAQGAGLRQEESSGSSHKTEKSYSSKSIGRLVAAPNGEILVHWDSAKEPVLTKEKKELEELRKELAQRKNRLRQQAEQQSRRLAIARAQLEEDRRAAIAEVVAASETQAKALEARERELAAARTQQAAIDLQELEENLKHERELFQQGEQKKLRTVISSFEERIKNLETQEQEIAASKKEQEEFVEKMSRDMERLQQQQQATQEKLWIAEIKRSLAEEDSMSFAEQAQKEKEKLEQKLAAANAQAEIFASYALPKKTEETEAVFDEAKKLETEDSWKKASEASQQIELMWQSMIAKSEQLLATAPQAEKEILKEELQNAQLQQEYWKLKIALADSAASLIHVCKASPDDKVAVIKANIAKARAVWAFFSRGFLFFKKDPTEENLKMAADAMDLSISYHFSSSDNGSSSMDTSLFGTIVFFAAPDSDMIPSLIHAADEAVNTPLEAGIRWLVTVAQDVIEFHKTAAEFRAEQETNKKIAKAAALQTAKNLIETKLNEIFELEKQCEVTFELPKNFQDEDQWHQAYDEAITVEAAWKEVSEACQKFLSGYEADLSAEEKMKLTSTLEQATSQQEYWKLKMALADSEAILLNVCESSPNDKVAIAKASFVRVQASWAFFSRAIKIFQKNQTEENLKVARTAANSLPASAPFEVEPRWDATAAQESIDSARAAAMESSSAAIYATSTSAGESSISAALAVGTPFEIEARWAATVAWETINFAKIAAEFQAKQEANKKIAAEFQAKQEANKKIVKAAKNLIQTKLNEIFESDNKCETIFVKAQGTSNKTKWDQAHDAATVVEVSWGEVADACQNFLLKYEVDLSKKEIALLNSALEKAKLQQEYWKLKIALADSEAAWIQVRKASPDDKVAIAKASFVRVQARWALFSKAFGVFKKDPTDEHLEIARTVLGDVVDTAATDTATYAAADLVVAAAAAARAADNVNVFVVRSDRAVELSVGTSFEAEARWATDAAREAADFAKAAAEFRAEQEKK